MMGADWSEDRVCVQSCNEMVIQPICMCTSGLTHSIMGQAQVIDLLFKRIEGDVSPLGKLVHRLGGRYHSE